MDNERMLKAIREILERGNTAETEKGRNNRS